ncbi:MAG: AMP-binding protein, partial [Rhodoferax sp.]
MSDSNFSATRYNRQPPSGRTVVTMLQSQSREFGTRPLLQIGTQAWRHDEGPQAAARHATLLQTAGIGYGDRVALMTANRSEFLEVFLGAAWLGAVSVPINTASMGPQIGYFLANSGARLLVIEESFLARLAQANLSATALQSIWIVGAGPALPQAIDGVACQAYPVATVDAAKAAPAAVLPGDTLALIYTSGTTGPAKGVICSHAQYYWWGVNSAAVLGLQPDDVLCTTLPLFHINALNTLVQAMVTGWLLVVAGLVNLG